VLLPDVLESPEVIVKLLGNPDEVLLTDTLKVSEGGPTLTQKPEQVLLDVLEEVDRPPLLNEFDDVLLADEVEVKDVLDAELLLDVADDVVLDSVLEDEADELNKVLVSSSLDVAELTEVVIESLKVLAELLVPMLELIEVVDDVLEVVDGNIEVPDETLSVIDVLEEKPVVEDMLGTLDEEEELSVLLAGELVLDKDVSVLVGDTVLDSVLLEEAKEDVIVLDDAEELEHAEGVRIGHEVPVVVTSVIVYVAVAVLVYHVLERDSVGNTNS
jgi:hypothetical protein